MAKRKAAPGTGAIRKRNNGLWEVMLYIGRNPKTGKRRYKSFYARRLADAIKKRDEWLREKRRIESGQYTVEEWMQHFFEEYQSEWKPATRDNYQWVLKLITENLGYIDIAKVKPQDLERFLAKLKKEGKSQSCISKVRSFMLQAFADAQANSIIDINPAALLRRTRRKKKPQQKEVFTLEEVRRIMREAPHTLAGVSLIVLVLLGIRKQELLTLTKQDIAPDGSWVCINKAMSRDHGRAYVSDTKTHSGVRMLPVPESMRKYVLMLREMCTGTYLWESPRKPGCVCNPSYFDDQYRNVLTLIGVRYLPPHNCRHTMLSHISGEAVAASVHVAQSLAGHAKPDATFGYIHALDKSKCEVMERWGDLLTAEEE